ncbi:MAG: hypothetical protein ACI9H6_000066 [Patiriisocius sp.]|jgi:hypothetical protein
MSPIISQTITFRGILYYLFLAALASLFVGYALFQARFILAGPEVAFINQPETLQSSRQVILEGNAQNIVRMTLNGRQIYTDKSGYFNETLVLENGYTVATLQAHDRYGSSSSYTQEFVYAPEKAK